MTKKFDAWDLVSDTELKNALVEWEGAGRPTRGPSSKTRLEERITGYRGGNGKKITNAWRTRLGKETEQQRVCVDCGGTKWTLIDKGDSV